jgi:hypothetical protein
MAIFISASQCLLESKLASIPTRLFREHNLHRPCQQILGLHRLAHLPEVVRLSMRLDRSSILVAAPVSQPRPRLLYASAHPDRQHDVPLQHDESRRVAFGLFLQVIPQCAGLVGFHCCCSFEKELFDLVDYSVGEGRVILETTYPVGFAGLGRHNGDDVDGHDLVKEMVLEER